MYKLQCTTTSGAVREGEGEAKFHLHSKWNSTHKPFLDGKIVKVEKAIEMGVRKRYTYGRKNSGFHQKTVKNFWELEANKILVDVRRSTKSQLWA